MHSLLKNDWRHRLTNIFNCVDLDVPPEIRREIEEMGIKAQKISQYFLPAGG